MYFPISHCLLLYSLFCPTLIPDECCFDSLRLLTHVNVCKSRPHKKPLSQNRLSHSILRLCVLKSSELTEQDLGLTITLVSVDAMEQCSGSKDDNGSLERSEKQALHSPRVALSEQNHWHRLQHFTKC